MTQVEVWEPERPSNSPALVHLVAVEESMQWLLTGRLSAAGIETCMYEHLRAFLAAIGEEEDSGLPCCLVIDAQPTTICGLEAQAILLPLSIRFPIVIVETPLCERKMVSLIFDAIECDRRQRLVHSRRAEISARHAGLTRRERQVMSLVVSGLMNKQVGGALGLSVITVKAYRGSVMRKMGARSLAELVRMADAIADCAGDAAGMARNGRSTPARIVADADLRMG